MATGQLAKPKRTRECNKDAARVHTLIRARVRKVADDKV